MLPILNYFALAAFASQFCYNFTTALSHKCRNLKKLVSSFNDCTESLIEHLKQFSDGQTRIPFRDKMGRITADAINKVLSFPFYAPMHCRHTQYKQHMYKCVCVIVYNWYRYAQVGFSLSKDDFTDDLLEYLKHMKISKDDGVQYLVDKCMSGLYQQTTSFSPLPYQVSISYKNVSCLVNVVHVF